MATLGGMPPSKKGRRGKRLWRRVGRRLWIPGCHVGDEIDHIFIGQVLHHRFHQRHRATLSRAVPDVVELADQIVGATAGQPGHIAKASEIRAMAYRALNGLSVATGRGKKLALLHAALRNEVYEAGMRVAE